MNSITLHDFAQQKVLWEFNAWLKMSLNPLPSLHWQKNEHVLESANVTVTHIWITFHSHLTYVLTSKRSPFIQYFRFKVKVTHTHTRTHTQMQNNSMFISDCSPTVLYNNHPKAEHTQITGNYLRMSWVITSNDNTAGNDRA